MVNLIFAGAYYYYVGVQYLEGADGLAWIPHRDRHILGRVSMPTTKIGFSGPVFVRPCQEGTSLWFRVSRQRKNSLMELESGNMICNVDRVGVERKLTTSRCVRAAK